MNNQIFAGLLVCLLWDFIGSPLKKIVDALIKILFHKAKKLIIRSQGRQASTH